MGIDNFIIKIKLGLNNGKYIKWFFKIACDVPKRHESNLGKKCIVYG